MNTAARQQNELQSRGNASPGPGPWYRDTWNRACLAATWYSVLSLGQNRCTLQEYMSSTDCDWSISVPSSDGGGAKSCRADVM